jgi:hypothetical protein
MKNMVRFKIITLILFCLLAAFGQTRAKEQERVIRFHSDIKIETDGRMEVAEHITVYVAGNEIKRGIVRDKLPLYRKDVRGKRVPVDYKVLSVISNGVQSPYHTERSSGQLEIYTGKEDVFLSPGVYEYVITYECYGQIGFFDDYDDLYWNVTGNGWIFTLEKVSAAVTLPGNAKMIQTACYTGAFDKKENDCEVESRGDVQVFTATRQMAPGEGLTIGVGFTRDIITRPPPPTAAEAFWYKLGSMIVGLLGLCVCAVYCLITLRRA